MSGSELIWARAWKANPNMGQLETHRTIGWGGVEYIRADAVAEMIRQAVMAEREAMMEIVHADFIWGALDNVHDCDTTLDDYADAVSRAQTSAIRARGEG